MVIVIGVAGVGKSTQCRLLEESGGFKWISVGQYLRETVTDPQQQAIMLAGDRLDDDYVISRVGEKIKALGDNPELIIDGFPRSIYQANWLIKEHENGNISISHVIHLTADEQIAEDRLEHRSRSDDTEKAIEERFSDYRANILPIINHFSQSGIKVVKIDGQRSIDEVQSELQGVLRIQNV